MGCANAGRMVMSVLLGLVLGGGRDDAPASVRHGRRALQSPPFSRGDKRGVSLDDSATTDVSRFADTERRIPVPHEQPPTDPWIPGLNPVQMRAGGAAVFARG